MRLTAVLFDFGNTLFAHASLPATIRQAAASLGGHLSDGRAQELAGLINAAAHAPEELQHPRDFDADVWRERWHVLYSLADDELPGLGVTLYDLMHAPGEWQPYAESLSTLRALGDAGVPVGVVSNTGWDVRTVFRHHGVEASVSHFVLSYEVGAVKPSPVIFEAACAALEVDPATTLMVGDDSVADAGAVRAGLRTLLLPALPPGASNGVDGVLALCR